MENVDEAFNDPINVSNVEDADKLIAAYNTVANEMKQKEQEHANLQKLVADMKAAGVTDFSGVTIEEINEQWNATKKLSEERHVALQKEHERQKANDALCVKFAAGAKDLSSWAQGMKDQLAVAKGELEQQLDNLQGLRTQYDQKQSALGGLESLNKQIEAAGVHRNTHTDISLRTLQSEYDQLGAAMGKQETLLTNEIMSKKNADVTPEQLNELKEVFKHFDKNHDGTLGRLELKACLQALGDEPSESELTDIMAACDKDGKGVSFASFSTFMSQRMKDKDSKDEIMESFKELAGGKDFVTEEDLRRVMPTDKVNYLISKMPRYKSSEVVGYDYKAWVNVAYQ